MKLKQTFLWIAGAALIPLAAGASTNLETTIAQNGAPITIDRCTALLQPTTGSNTDEPLSEFVEFTNVSQRTATEVGFAFEIVDAIGRTERTVTADRRGKFVPGISVNDSPAPTDPNGVQQTANTAPRARNVVCSVRIVRFDDGSVWHEGDGPAGSAAVYTPLPAPSATAPWQFPEDWATP